MSMTPKEALEYLKKAGVPDGADLADVLAEEVFDAKEAEAEALNAIGVEEQLGYLLFGKNENEKIIDKIVAEYRLGAGLNADGSEGTTH